MSFRRSAFDVRIESTRAWSAQRGTSNVERKKTLTPSLARSTGRGGRELIGRAVVDDLADLSEAELRVQRLSRRVVRHAAQHHVLEQRAGADFERAAHQ